MLDNNVNPSDSSSDQNPVPVSDPSPSQDVANEALSGDRPVKNLQAEMNRKVSALEAANNQLQSQLTNVAAYVAALFENRVAPQQAQNEQQLWAAAAQGDPAATSAVIQQQVAQQVAVATAQNREAQQVQTRAQTLLEKYPDFKSADTPLCQVALSYKQSLLQSGFRGLAADVRAMEAAIADNPQLVASRVHAPAVAGEIARQGAVATAATGQMGSSGRRAPVNRKDDELPPLTEREHQIAARMGIKDGVAARKRFFERQRQGRTAVSPLVSNILSGTVREA